MNGHPRWRDVEAVAQPSDRKRSSRLAAPRAYAVDLGGRNRAAVRPARRGLGVPCLARLRALGLVGEMRVALRARRNPGLLYLTDLGLATVAADRTGRSECAGSRQAGCVVPIWPTGSRACPRCSRSTISWRRWPYARTGRIDLLAWEQPWRRTFSRPTRRSAIAVEVPAHAVLSWDDQAAALLLLPDLATSPLGIHRQMLARLLELRGMTRIPLPWLVVATTDARIGGWNRLLDADCREPERGTVGRARRDVARATLRRCSAEADRPQHRTHLNPNSSGACR